MSERTALPLRYDADGTIELRSHPLLGGDQDTRLFPTVRRFQQLFVTEQYAAHSEA
jgi:hypothetical protein